MAGCEIYSGICGFETRVKATSGDRRMVHLEIVSNCPDVMRIAKDLIARTFDAFAEIGPCRQPGSMYETEIMRICSRLPHVACPVPAGICKAVEIVAGLALPRDAHIRVLADEEWPDMHRPFTSPQG